MRKPVFQRKSATTATTSFAQDIAPLFQQVQGPMMWRFDLTSYEAVSANAETIWGRIAVSRRSRR